jgi:hypothetical protein
VWNGNIQHRWPKRSSKLNRHQKKVMLTVLLGFTGPSMETIKRGTRQQTVPVTVEVRVACVAYHATFLFSLGNTKAYELDQVRRKGGRLCGKLCSCTFLLQLY